MIKDGHERWSEAELKEHWDSLPNDEARWNTMLSMTGHYSDL